MLRIGLTGGIGAGKSVASARLAELGAVVVDYDALAREVVAPGTVALEEIAETFGAQAIAADGTLDRAAVARLVFEDPPALEMLNEIVHPEVGRVAAEREAQAAAADPRAVVVHDVPLLVEGGGTDHYHLVVVVDAPEAIRLRRLVDTRGLSEDEARARIAAQADDATRRAVADVILDGTGDVEHLRGEVDALWRRVAAETETESRG